MNAVNDCKDRFESIVALVMGELDPAAARELQDHIARCDGCREAWAVLTEEEKEIRLGFEALARSLGPVEQAVLSEREHQSRVRIEVSNNHFLERVKTMILAHKRLSAAAATVTTLAASLIVYVSLFSSATAAYALEQIVAANSHVTSYHVKITHDGQRLREAWIQVNPDDSLVQARLDFPKTEDGAKVSIVAPGRAEVWFKTKNIRVISSNKELITHTTDELAKARSIYDPKLALEKLQAERKAGKAEVATKQPANPGEPITLTVTSKAAPDRREVYEVDSATKLVERVTDYRRQGNKWEQVSERQYLDYNKPIDPKVFQLDLPKGVMTIDHTRITVGLERGTLSDNEIAKKVVREFFEAVIGGDFQKASPLYEGVPAEHLKGELAKAHIKYLRIVEIGMPQRVQHPDKSALKVPVKLEAEVNGKKLVQEITPYVRPEQDGRWTICGGF
jgi:hypothetical protein